MKTIPVPDLKSAEVLTAPQLNHLHFGGRHTRLAPKTIDSDAASAETTRAKSTISPSDAPITIR